MNLEDLNMKWSRKHLPFLIGVARRILEELGTINIEHPSIKGIKGVYSVRSCEEISRKPYKAYGVLIFGSRERLQVDRSPSGTVSSAHLAWLYANGTVGLNEEAVFISAIGTSFKARALRETKVGSFKAIVPEVSTTDKGGYVIGFNTWVLGPEDPLGFGYALDY